MPKKTTSLTRLSVFIVRAEFSNFHFLFREKLREQIFLATNDEEYKSQNVSTANARLRQCFGASL